MGFVHGRYAELALEVFIMVEGQLNLFASISHCHMATCVTKFINYHRQ